MASVKDIGRVNWWGLMAANPPTLAASGLHVIEVETFKATLPGGSLGSTFDEYVRDVLAARHQSTPVAPDIKARCHSSAALLRVLFRCAVVTDESTGRLLGVVPVPVDRLRER